METIQQKKIRATFGGSMGHGWDTMIKYFLILLLVVIVMGIIHAPMQIGNLDFKLGDFRFDDWDHFNDFDFNWFNPGIAVVGMLAFVLGVIAVAYWFLVIPVFKYGGDLMFVHGARGIRPQFDSLISGFKENYLYIVLANLLTGALVMLGIIFLIIPGIIIGCRLAFVSYLVMDKKLDPIRAVEESWRLTRGHGWTIFFMAIVAFFLGIVGFAMLFVGILPVTMWVKSAYASLYEAALQEKNAEPEPVAA